ncbi:MAG TPA: dihydrofolate reductase family protein [Chryseosolibacter sp.]
MRKLILSANITLDGYMAGEYGELDWHFSHWNGELMESALEQLRGIDTILVGRVAYESMSLHWPTAERNRMNSPSEAEFAQTMNRLQKIVFSKTLNKTSWNNSTLMDEIDPMEIQKLKRQQGKDMIIWGGVTLVSAFLEKKLFDEYRISIAPIVIGKGISISKEITRGLRLKLLHTRVFSNGVVTMTYRNRD